MRRLFAALLTLTLVLSFSASTLAQATPESSPLFTIGEQIKATRIYSIAELELTGTLAFNFTSSLMDTDEHAEDAFYRTIELWQSHETELKNQTFNEISGPSLYDESLWFVATGEHEGTDFQIAGVVFLTGKLVHLWVALGIVGTLVSELESISNAFSIEVPDDVNEQTILSVLPSLSDLPTGYLLAKELVEPGDDPS